MPLTSPACPGHFNDAEEQNIVDDLVERGWSQQDNFLPKDLTLALAVECRDLSSTGTLKAAGVGHGATKTVRPDIRGDQIFWLKAGHSVACDRYLQIMETLRVALNRSLYLGLDEFESHFALYAPGACYLKHRDRFRDDDCRVVSTVVYLNQDWLPGQGGALRLHPHGKTTEDILPLDGRLALFLSADLLHEVLPATRDRLSLVGWFRRRPG
ncbi:MAG: SM-20-related protein [Burkholderiales bacterium]|jgi:SM-20-related protein|nr:hypothetical protein [Burkholderia sp.]